MGNDIEPHAFTVLGGTPHTEDTRDYQLGKLQAPVPYPPVFKQENAWELPIFYQGNQPACGAHAGAWFKMFLDSYESKPRNYSPRFTWADIKSFDGIDPSLGTEIRAIMKSLANSGAADFFPLGNDVDLSLNQYTHPTTITAEMRQMALPRLIDKYAFDGVPTWDSLKRAIYLNRAVIMRIEVGEEFWTAPSGLSSWKESDILPLRSPKKVVSGHFVVAHGYDDQYVYFANSFSDTWGRKGHGYFTKEYMPHITHFMTAVDVPDTVLPLLLQQKSMLQKIVELLKAKLGLK